MCRCQFPNHDVDLLVPGQLGLDPVPEWCAEEGSCDECDQEPTDATEKVLYCFHVRFLLWAILPYRCMYVPFLTFPKVA